MTSSGYKCPIFFPVLSNKVKQTLAGLTRSRLQGKYIDLRIQCWSMLKTWRKVLVLLVGKEFIEFPNPYFAQIKSCQKWNSHRRT